MLEPVLNPIWVLIGFGERPGRWAIAGGAIVIAAVLAQGQVIGNPHNQTLNVAVQWGVAGVVVLYAMWWFHLMLFRGDGLVTWIGLLVVV